MFQKTKWRLTEEDTHVHLWSLYMHAYTHEWAYAHAHTYTHEHARERVYAHPIQTKKYLFMDTAHIFGSPSLDVSKPEFS